MYQAKSIQATEYVLQEDGSPPTQMWWDLRIYSHLSRRLSNQKAVQRVFRSVCNNFAVTTLFTFSGSYKILASEASKEPDLKKACQIILNKCGIDNTRYQFGLTKIFLRAGQVERIERGRMTRVNECAVIIQKNVRRHIQRQKYARIIRAIELVQVCSRQYFAHKEFVFIKRTVCATIIQAKIRGFVAQRGYSTQLSAAMKVQRAVRKFQAKKAFAKQIHRREMLLIIQSRIRGHLSRQVYFERLFQAKNLEALKNQKAELEDRVKTMEEKQALEERERIELTERASDLEKQLALGEAKVQQIREDLASRIKVLENEIAELNLEIHRLNQSLLEEKQGRERVATEQTNLTKEICRQTNELAVQQERYNSLQEEKNSTEQNWRVAVEQRDHLSENCEQLQADVETHKQQIKIFDEKIKELQCALETNNTENSNLIVIKNQLEKQLVNKTHENQEYMEEVKKLGLHIQTLDTEIIQKQQQIKQIMEKADDVNKDMLEHYSLETDKLNKSISSLIEDRNSLQTNLKEALKEGKAVHEMLNSTKVCDDLIVYVLINWLNS